MTNEKGVKYDDGKVNFVDTFSGFYQPIVELTRLYDFGAKKHGVENWKLVSAERYKRAVLRHAIAIAKGEIWNEESFNEEILKIPHSISLAWNGLALAWFTLNGIKEKK